MSHINKNWIIGILFAVIALLSSLFIIIDVVNYDKLMDMLSLLSSIVSLVLSVFAIFYSYHSIVKSDESSEKLSSALTKIEAYNVDMKDNNNQLLKTVLMIKDKVAVIEANQNPEDKKITSETAFQTDASNKPSSDHETIKTRAND